MRSTPRTSFAGSAVCASKPISTTWLVTCCSTTSLCLASTATCTLSATATCVCAAIARLSGSVSEIWLSPVWSSSASISLWRSRLANRSDLFGQVFDPRAARCALGGVALFEALKIIVELGVSGFDELGQRRPREIAILVVDRLDPRPVHRQQLPAKQVQLAA